MTLSESRPASSAADTASTPSTAARAQQVAPHVVPVGQYQRLARWALVPSQTNPRTHFDAAHLEELAATIRDHDILQPLLVRPLPAARLQETFADRRKGDPLPTHEIVAGERRYRASGLAKLETLPVLIRDLTDAQVLRMQVIENVERESLHPLEEAGGYRRILDLPDQAELPMEQRVEALAKDVKKSTRYIYQTLQLLKLCDFARQVFLEGKLLRTVALQVATIGNEAQQIEAVRRIAGLKRSGKLDTEQVEPGMSQREAANYVRNTFRLLLERAPFPIKVKLAGVDSCESCEKNSANASQLFEEDAVKGPATCMDPSCYGKKNVAHNNQVAEAARKDGQRVITGKKAEQVMPYSSSTNLTGGYTSLEDRRYDVIDKLQGKTVAQILKGDHPKPVLLEDRHHGGFIEVLPEADIVKLLKERGLHKGTVRQVNDQQREINRKAEAEKKLRRALAEALLAAVDKFKADAPVPFPPDSAGALLSQLQLGMGLQIYNRLDHESSKRVRSLLGWEIERGSTWGAEGKKVAEHFRSLDPVQFNRFVVAAAIADELHVNQYGRAGTDDMERIAHLVGVDFKALRAKLQQEAKDAEKAKTKAKAAPAKVKEAKAPKKVAAPAPAAPTRTIVRDGKKVSVKPAKPAKASKKAKAKEEQIGLELSQPAAHKPGPSDAWPFPTAKASDKATAA